MVSPLVRTASPENLHFEENEEQKKKSAFESKSGTSRRWRTRSREDEGRNRRAHQSTKEAP